MLIAIGRNLLILIATMIVVGISVAVWPIGEVRPEKQLTDIGARLTYAFDGTMLVGVLLEGSKFDDDHAAIAAKIPTIKRVSFADSRVTERGIRSLQSLHQLGYLDLRQTFLAFDSVDEISQLTPLKELNLEGCRWLRDEHLSQLASLPNLELLNLSDTQITAAALDHLGTFPALKCLLLNHCSSFDDTVIDRLIQFCQARPITLSLSWTEISRLGLARLRSSLPDIAIYLSPETMVGLRDVGERGVFITGSDGEIIGFRPRRHPEGWIPELRSGDLAVVSSLPEIKRLNLDFTSVTDDLLLQLGPMPQLESLRLCSTLVTDRGLKVLENLPNLKSLLILENDINGDGFENLRFVPHVQTLKVQTRMGDAILPFLAQLSDLRTLSIHAPLSDSGLEQLSRLEQLNSLELVQTTIRRAGVEKLVNHPSLTELTFEGGSLDDSDLDAFSNAKSLSQIVLSRTSVTQAGANRLMSLLPNARIFWAESTTREDPRHVARRSR